MRERNSSFQNVNLFITAISRRGSSGAGFTVGLSDGSSFFVSSSFCHQFQLEINQSADQDLLEMLEVESDSIKALQKAGELIARAEQSSGGLYIKLKKKGFSDIACSSAVESVVDAGLLDDERFAQFWIASRLRKHPEGRTMLYKGLVTRGVKPEKAKSAIRSSVSEEDLQKAVLKAGKKLSVKYGQSDQKLRQALYRRGFSSEEITYYFDSSDI
ncbi:MAG: regulatory protein RecX [Spirochaetaceae bacterium]|nr:regulatory protein RecX [Spirochaetaceae bacterium]